VLKYDDKRDDDDEESGVPKQIQQRAIGRDGKWVTRGGGANRSGTSGRGGSSRKLAVFF
jgi:hypothetical protein